ncbi:hypothetical protein Agub_g2317 [Astrephomene gubernaculifera]|uniref:Uncharacterized protein n=1 Tax=Astrephomene gubernaculifera TaxID=47775 RepID=A0AAD3DGW0_9CHLO|nr:hypothetical protein Agub_g2317 [Astrephomene gubernaculifera]
MDPQQREQLRTALIAYGADLTRFEDTDLDILWHNRYRDVRGLQDATREGLKAAGLPYGLIDHILKRQGAAAGLGLGSPADAGEFKIFRTILEQLNKVEANQRMQGEQLNKMQANQRMQEEKLKFTSRIALANLKEAFRPPSSTESHDSSADFRARVAKFYGVSDKMKCMVLGKELPAGFLVARHLVAEGCKYAGVMMGIIWNSAIEHEYNDLRICFSYDGLGGSFMLHVLDKSLLPVQLSSVGRHRDNPDFAEVLGNVTFGDLHNKPVDFTGVDSMRPFKRALAEHAKLALVHQVKTYPDGFDPQMYNFNDWSEHEGNEEFVRTWLNNLDTGSVWEGGTSVDPEESVDDEKVDC